MKLVGWRHTAILSLATVLMFSSAALASTSPVHENLDAGKIREQQAQIRADAEARRGRYEHLSEQTRQELFAKQDVVDRLTRGLTATTELPEVQRIELFNSLESISAIINRAEDDRLICERVRPVGSNRPTTFCQTVAERRRHREAMQIDVHRRDQR